MAMKSSFSWLTCFCFIFETGILCDTKLEKQPTISACPGLVIGWGQTENMVESTVLLEANIPYIDHQTCRNMYQNGFQIFVTVDKFCAGTKSEQGVHQGDSGAGFTLEHNSLHFLTGVVSVKDSTTNDSIAVFTDVSRHVSWIHNIYTNYTYAIESFSRSVFE